MVENLVFHEIVMGFSGNHDRQPGENLNLEIRIQQGYNSSSNMTSSIWVCSKKIQYFP